MKSISQTRSKGLTAASPESDPVCHYLDRLLDNYEQFMLRRRPLGQMSGYSDVQAAT